MNLTRRILAFFILTVSLVANQKICAALATTAWYTPITRSVGICANSYKTWRMVHPRLATSSDVLVLAGALIWVFNRFVKPANHKSQQDARGSEKSFFYPDGQEGPDVPLAPDRTQYGSSSDDEKLTRLRFNPPSL